jgi:hypothetical protein
MQKMKIAAAVLVLAIPDVTIAASGTKADHRLVGHRRVHQYGAPPYGGDFFVAPRILHHPDATRPGGIDPSFNPPPT